MLFLIRVNFGQREGVAATLNYLIVYKLLVFTRRELLETIQLCENFILFKLYMKIL